MGSIGENFDEMYDKESGGDSIPDDKPKLNRQDSIQEMIGRLIAYVQTCDVNKTFENLLNTCRDCGSAFVESSPDDVLVIHATTPKYIDDFRRASAGSSETIRISHVSQQKYPQIEQIVETPAGPVLRCVPPQLIEESQKQNLIPHQ